MFGEETHKPTNKQTHRGGKRAALTFLKQISDEVNYIININFFFIHWKIYSGNKQEDCMCLSRPNLELLDLFNIRIKSKL